MKFKIRYILSIILISSLTMGISGCNSSRKDSDSVYSETEAADTIVMNVGDAQVSIGEALIYAIQYLYVQGIVTDGLTESAIEQYKGDILDSIRQTKIIYDVAINNDTQLDEDDYTYIDTFATNTINTFDESFWNKYGITEDLIKEVCTEQYIVEKFSQNIKSDMYNSIVSDLDTAYEDYTYVTIYLMRFPTVEKDENNEPKTDSDGNYVYVSDEEKESVKADAESAISEIRSGTAYEDVADKYAVTDYSYENNGYIGGYSDELNEALKGLANGDCTDIYEDDLGYGFAVMVDNDNEESKQAYIEYQANDTLDSEFSTLQQKWLSTIAVDEENDMNGSIWADFDLKAFIDDMNNLRASQ